LDINVEDFIITESDITKNYDTIELLKNEQIYFNKLETAYSSLQNYIDGIKKLITKSLKIEIDKIVELEKLYNEKFNNLYD